MTTPEADFTPPAAADWQRTYQITLKSLRGEPLTPGERDWQINQDRIRAEAAHDQLMREYDWTGSGPRWRTFLLHILRRRGNWAYVTSDDDTCEIMCACGQSVWVAGESWISWCPKCNRGYTATIRVRQYPAWLRMGRPDKSNLPE